MKVEVTNIIWGANAKHMNMNLPSSAIFDVEDRWSVRESVDDQFDTMYGIIPEDYDVDSDDDKIDRVKTVLRRYFECNDNGDPNNEYDCAMSAQEAIEDIHSIVGEI